MNFQDCLASAVESILTWEIPDSDFAQAVQAQACLMAGINPDEILWLYAE